ncbi:hypothetical protein JI666_13960 [Bacillus sp. NTK071]|uniref:hypothetical protein n=1 Tax=Bacillus sp. NTK071 TaxID=2802175 RepID=UPI001A8F22F1|nr:hypothetical protein [Bacillus sp. NTK071]MBN8209857.1 hypothetical protein [Bacillus sp. NTK071]
MTIKFQKSIFFLTALLTLTLVFNEPANANEQLEIEIDSDGSSIILDWNSVGVSYEIYQKGAKVDTFLWSGTVSNFTTSKLDPQKPYSFKLVAKNKDGKVIDFLQINTSLNYIDNTSEKIASKQAINESYIQSIVSKDEIVLDWTKIPNDNTTYEVYRNGEFIKEVNGFKYIDSNINNEETYRYEIKGKVKIHPDELKNKISELKKAQNSSKLSEDIIRKLEYDEYSLVHNVLSLKTDLQKNVNTFKKISSKSLSLSSSQSQSASSSYQYVPSYALTHYTWIKDSKVDLPLWPIYYAYGGDGRNTPYLFQDDYRTKVVSTAKFYGGSNISYSMPVTKAGTSYGYRIGGGIDVDHASMSDVYPHSINKYSDKISFDTHHSVSNPMQKFVIRGQVETKAVSPPIDYDYRSSLYKDGSYSISGSHDNTPSHAIYISTYGGDSHCLLYWHDSWENMSFLTGLFISKDFKVSGNNSSCPYPYYS